MTPPFCSGVSVKLSRKTLLIGFGILAVLWGVLHEVDRSIGEPKNAAPEKTWLSPRASGEQVTDKRRPHRLRARQLSSKEAMELVRRIVIPSYEVEDVTLSEALEILNAKIAEQIPEGQPKPKAKLSESAIERIKIEDQDLADALGASVDELGSAELRIDELRVRNIPPLILLQYICDATRHSFFVYRGDFYLHADWPHHSSIRFREEEVLPQVRYNKVPLDRVMAATYDIVSAHEFYGHKSGIQIQMSDKGMQALRRGEVAMPVIDLDLRNVTLKEVVDQIEMQSEGLLQSRGGWLLFFNPLNEQQEGNPFDPNYAVGGVSFDHVLNEDWNKPEEQHPAE